MRTDIKDIDQAVRELMAGIYYTDGVAVDYTTTIIDANPAEPADASVALYMGDAPRTWDVVAQQWRDGAPAAWLTLGILIDDPGRGTIAVYQHDGDDYTDVLDYIELDTADARDDTEAIELEAQQLYAGLRGRTLDYIRRVMLPQKVA